MPFQIGGIALHDDVLHTGSAKRDTANGVAGVDATNHVISPGSTIKLKRDGTESVFLTERTSVENIQKMTRMGGNDYDLFVKEAGVYMQILTAGMTYIGEVASGSYVGDSTVNKAIAHTRTKEPKAVLIPYDGGIGFMLYIIKGIPKVISSNGSTHAVTAPDATNFYVGNATSYGQSANTNGVTYYWSAIF